VRATSRKAARETKDFEGVESTEGGGGDPLCSASEEGDSSTVAAVEVVSSACPLTSRTRSMIGPKCSTCSSTIANLDKSFSSFAS